jgi:hypothetical protein|tara:strand:- start:1142 stop:1786 length:645 start_codon:yes stop_codon:yes gene_type:complete
MPIRISKRNSIKSADNNASGLYGQKARVYTKGGEFYNGDGSEYVGLFWSSGEKTYSGKSPEDKNSKRIYRKPLLNQNPNYNELNTPAYFYEKLKEDYSRRVPPIKTTLPQLTAKDINKGVIKRYFVKTGNTSQIVEISKKQHKALKSSSEPIKSFIKLHELVWKISGPDNDIIDGTGTIQMAGIIETNERTINNSEMKFPGLRNFIGILNQFSV